MKKILVVVDGLNKGGIASVVLNISEAANKNLFKFDYVTYQEPNTTVTQRLEERGSNVYIVNRLSQTTPLKYIKSIQKIIKENGPYDVLHAHTSSFIWLACLAGKLEKIPIRIGHAHGSKNAREFFMSDILYSFFRVLNRNYCTHMLTCADTSGKFTFGNDYIFVPNFIDFTKYKILNSKEKDKLLEILGIRRNVTKFCFIGNLAAEKNPMFAIELFKEILLQDSNTKLFILGDGLYFDLIKKYIRDNNMEANVLMFGNTDKVNEILQISDVMLMPSLSEGMSVAALEAQLLGVPCIVSKGVPMTNDIHAGLFFQCQTFEKNEWHGIISNVKESRNKVTRRVAIKALKEIGYDKDSVIKIIEGIYLY